MNTFLVQKKYNYGKKVKKAIKEGNLKYLRMLIKKGKILILDNDASEV